MATLRDIARHLDLSVTQVSRALGDHADVSVATKERVREAARTLGYRPNLAARRLRSGRSGLVAMIVPALADRADRAILMETVMGLSAEFSARGMQFVLHVLSPGEDAAAAHERLVRAGSFDGVVITDPVIDDPRIATLGALDVPFVVHGRDRDAPRYPFVDLDHHAIGRRLGEALLARGVRRIAWLGGPDDRLFDRTRRAGLKAALEAAGLVLDPAHVTNGSMSVARGGDEARTLAARGADGIAAGNTMLALGARRALPGMALAAHDDGLAGFGSDRIAPPYARTFSPLSLAWRPLCDALDAAIARRDPQQVILIADPDHATA